MKQLLDEVFVIFGVIKLEVSVISRAEPKAEADDTYQDLGYSRYHKNLILELFYYTLFWRK